MSRKTKIRIVGYTITFSSIIFSLKYLAQYHETFVLPVLFGTLLIVLPLEKQLKKIDDKKIPIYLSWPSYMIVVLCFIWSLLVI